ncbi:MAG: proline dehydrogenase family protein [Phycisphaerae bacterium]|jgi:RHH-type proline utilization regulon transcriptional repressor/proline dehydrogenase/delta 1-pyrroline-5-carboxylate dehydrogenase|nr:proline dehydrogenase family protein [Phycisphaerae bacterium]
MEVGANMTMPDERILARGREMLGLIDAAARSGLGRGGWQEWLLNWSMRHEGLKRRIFSFIASLPQADTPRAFGALLKEHFVAHGDVPWLLRAAARAARATGPLAMRMVRGRAEEMARRFIIGASATQTVRNLTRLRRRGYAFTLDVLGESARSDACGERYVRTYLRLLDRLAAAQNDWTGLVSGGQFDWGSAPRINVSIKPSALAPGGDLAGMLDRAGRIYENVIALGGYLCIDMESLRLKDVTYELYRRLRTDTRFGDWAHLGLAVQTYLRSTDSDLTDLLDWARSQGVRISVRLVKGAYWDSEVAAAEARGVRPPVYTVKAETDAAFERAAVAVLRDHDICHLACASHNIRSVCAVLETARALGVPESHYEFQLLYGMAELFRIALLQTTPRVRLYCPHGDMLVGMAYLIRRLQENTSNESILRQEFAPDADPADLLVNPVAHVS